MRRILAALVTAVTLAGATACGSDEPAPAAPAPATRISVGVLPIVDVAPIYLGKQKGFFARRGIDLTLVVEQAGPAVVKGVTGGKYQFGFSNLVSLMAARSGGAPVRAVASGVASTGRVGRDFSGIVVPYGSPIRSPRDLAGKRVAVNAVKSLGDTTVRQSVRKDGGDPSGIRFEAMPFPKVPQQLQARTIDAAWLVEPQLSEAVNLGGQVIASNFVDTAPELPVAAWFTDTGLGGKDATVVGRFTEAINESMKYATEHPDEVRMIVGTYTPISETVRLMMILPHWPSTINRSSAEQLAVLGGQDGIFTSAPVLDDLLPPA